MPFQLRDHVHWCVCAGRVVFLDLEADRYFCLSKGGNEAFLRLARCNQSPADAGAVQALVARGLLIETGGNAALRMPPSIEPPSCDVPTEQSPGVRPHHLVRAMICELRAGWLLKRSSLLEVLQTAGSQGSDRRSVPRDLDRSLTTIVEASSALALFTRVHNRCLVRALAVHAMCKNGGIGSKLVFGVIAHPFAAHCWVQLGSAVLVGGFEQARLYTPILVVE